MDELCNALIQIKKGIKTPDQVIWHLEPHCYYLHITNTGPLFHIQITESTDYLGPQQPVLSIRGGLMMKIIMPLYRGIKKFASFTYDESHWRKINPERIQYLTDLIKSKKP